MALDFYEELALQRVIPSENRPHKITGPKSDYP